MPLVNLVNELAKSLDFQLDAPKEKCTLFEDNQSNIVVVKPLTMLHWMKYISMKNYHFKHVLKRDLCKFNEFPKNIKL